MTAFNYAQAKATADRLIARFGQSGYIRRTPTTGAAYNPTQGTPADHACTFVITDYTSRQIDGTRILAGDKKALVAVGALSITPGTADRLLDPSAPGYKIVEAMPLNPGGTVVMYEMQVRR